MHARNYEPDLIQARDLDGRRVFTESTAQSQHRSILPRGRKTPRVGTFHSQKPAQVV